MVSLRFRSALSNFLVLIFSVLGIVNGPARAGGSGQQNQKGAAVFYEYRCFACHGSFGDGTLGPSFGGDRMLNLTSYVVSQILVGGGEMPPFGAKLTDKQIAAVAEYIRNNWGNSFGPVTSDEVT